MKGHGLERADKGRKPTNSAHVTEGHGFPGWHNAPQWWLQLSLPAPHTCAHKHLPASFHFKTEEGAGEGGANQNACEDPGTN